jgi:glycosyltransferase involved in cell wall biosynthesis
MPPPPTPPVAVSVLVPVLDEAATIEATVAAMLAQELDGRLELIFADGASTDGTRSRLEALARTDDRIRVFGNPDRGTASGLNVCLREARGEYVARMDAHTYFGSDYLARGIERLQRGDTTWVAGPQRPRGRGRVSRSAVAALESPLGRGASRKWASDGDDSPEFDLDTGVFCGVWRRDDVLRHGGWDEGWPRNQDSELAARFLRNGERIVCVPAMAADYLPRDAFGGLFRQYRQYGQYRARTALRHPDSLRRSALLPPVLVLTAAAAVVAPRPLRTLARIGAGVYAAALGASAAQTAVRGRPLEAALLPAVLPTMHLAHGLGFFEGARRWGFPARAVLRAVGIRRPEDEAPYTGPVHAPNLHGGEPR